MVALRVTVSLPSIAFANSLVRCRPAQRPLFAAFASFSSGGATCGQASPLQRQLVLYTKPGCCLCEGLKEKLQAALSLGGSHSLHSVQLQEILPRLSPRLGVELIQKKIAAALEQ
ncbi:uncharacterized protein LOC110101421 isoform X2 [Dendrobium catenatum]|uniref:uncharacterized protein LOC110101421 isoform X2 n=1 Tax=Dendrobium catenatum TaxID=906689 RepID=UPI00109EF35F|nr:uncharacterized protein LOC110101421 isoform X2 [Dendrobium catenatum]